MNDIIDIRVPRGKHCFMWGNHKVFDCQPVDKTATDGMWVDIKISEATIIQNICWLYGLAPRVYKLEKVRFLDQIFMSQVTEVVDGFGTQEEAFEVYDKVVELGKEYGWVSTIRDVSHVDVMDGKLIDFNTFKLVDNWREKFAQKYVELGTYGKRPYHNILEWSVKGSPRRNEERVSWLGLDKLDFNHKNFLDIGCAGGYFVRYAFSRGARSSTGVDWNGDSNRDINKAAYIASFGLGYHKIEFENKDLREYEPKKRDIVLFASMNFHIGIPDWLAGIANEVVIFEDNSKERNAKETLDKMFGSVELVGSSPDHGDKPIYHCKP